MWPEFEDFLLAKEVLFFWLLLLLLLLDKTLILWSAPDDAVADGPAIAAVDGRLLVVISSATFGITLDESSHVKLVKSLSVSSSILFASLSLT